MMPSTAIQPHSRTGTRKRILQEIRISPEPVPPEDVLLRAESDDDSDGTRAWKKARREAFALQYLEHGWVPIMTAKLKGPFDEGWKNPWAKRKPKATLQDLGHHDKQSVSPGVRQTSSKVVRSRIDISKVSSRRYSEARVKTDLPYSELPKLSSSTTKHQPMSIQRGNHPRKQSPNVRPLRTSRLDSPSRQLYQQLQDAVSQEPTNGFHSSDSELESDEGIGSGLQRSPAQQRLPRKSLQHSRRRSSDINRSVTRDVVPLQATDAAARLEDDLNLLWERTKIFSCDGLPRAMRLEHVKTDMDAPKKSEPLKKTLGKPVITYTGKPIIPGPNREGITRFSVRQFKDIQNKLSAGVAMVQQRLDAVKASRNPSDTITCCDMLIQLAQTRERVDHVVHLYRVYKDLPKDSKLTREAWKAFSFYQSRPPIEYSLDSSDSFHGAESDSYLTDDTREAEKNNGTNIVHARDEVQLLAEQNEAEEVADKPNRFHNNIDNDGDIDMDEASDLESIDIPLDDAKEEQEIQYKASSYIELSMQRNAHGAIADNVRHGDYPDEIPIEDRHDILRAFTDAKSKKYDHLRDTPSRRDLDGQRLAGTTFVAEVDKSVVKPFNDEVLDATDILSAHSGSTQMNTPEDAHLSDLQSQGIQSSKLSDGKEQKQSLAEEPQIAKLHMQAQYQSPINPNLDHAIEPGYKLKSDSNSTSIRSTSPAIDNARPFDKFNLINNGKSAAIPSATHPVAPEASILQNITIIDLDSGSDTSEDDAQYQSPLKLIKSGNNETLHSIADVETPAVTPVTESGSVAKSSDMAQEHRSLPAANIQPRLERFTHFLQGVNLRVQKKTSQQQSQNDIQNNSKVKPMSPAKIVLHRQTSDQNGLSHSLNLPRPNDKNFNPLVHSTILQEQLERPFQTPAMPKPYLARTSTTEKEKKSPQGSYRATVPSPSHNSPKISQRHVISYESKPWFPTSQPVMSIKPSKDIQPDTSTVYPRTMSNGIEIPRRHTALGMGTASIGAEPHGGLQGTEQATIQDAQRFRPHITDSEERDALDIASGLLGNWDAEKEASTR